MYIIITLIIYIYIFYMLYTYLFTIIIYILHVKYFKNFIIAIFYENELK